MKMLKPIEREVLEAPADAVMPSTLLLEETVHDLARCGRLLTRPNGPALMFRNTAMGDKALRIDALIRAMGVTV